MAPAITVTEDNSTPVDDDDFVEYYGLQAYVEGNNGLSSIYTYDYDCMTSCWAELKWIFGLT